MPVREQVPARLRPHLYTTYIRLAMTTLHRFAASTLRASTRPSLSQRAPALVRRETIAAHNPGMAAGVVKDRPTSDSKHAPTATHGDAEMIRQEGAAEGTPHNPDYNVSVDYRTS